MRNTILAAIAFLLAGPCATTSAAVTSDLATPQKKEIAMELVSSAENSTLDWRSQFDYIEDIHDGRGYTGGIIGFTSRTGDMLELVRIYTRVRPHNPLARFLPALQRVNGSASHRGLGPKFVRAWKRAANDRAFQRAQEKLRDRDYFNPAVNLAKQDGLRALGQFCYYDAAVVHGFDRLQAIRRRALARAEPPVLGGDEVTYLNAFLDERDVEMLKEKAHSDLSRVETEQRKFLREGNLDLNAPLHWFTYGDPYTIPARVGPQRDVIQTVRPNVQSPRRADAVRSRTQKSESSTADDSNAGCRNGRAATALVPGRRTAAFSNSGSLAANSTAASARDP